MGASGDEFQCQFVAQLLCSEAPDLAACTARHMMSCCPELSDRYRPLAAKKWQLALEGRIAELAAAIGTRRPELFSAQLCLAKAAFTARRVPLDDLLKSLHAMEAVLIPRVPPEDRALVRSYLLRAQRDIGRAPEAPPPFLTTTAAHARLTSSYLVAVLEGNRRQACTVLTDAARAGLDVRTIYTQVLTPALHELGRLWLLDEISVVEEHFATATTITAMSQLLGMATCEPHNGKTLVAAAIEGNQHEVGLRMVTDLFEMQGWRTVYLGANVPSADLPEAVADFGADLVALSISLAVHLRPAADLIKCLRSCCEGRPPKILVGGMAFSGVPGLWEDLGADGYAPNAAGAVAVGTSLCTVTGA